MNYSIKRINDIKIIREIGSGGMGVVYEGFDTILERKVAVKMMLPNTLSLQGKKRFLKEAALMAKIVHPLTIDVYSFGEFEINGQKIPYFVMEYIEGKSLADIINRLKLIKENDFEELKNYGYLKTELNINDNYFLKNFSKIPIYDKEWIENSSILISSIADALYEIHNTGIIHRDIKPSNILISKKGPKIADFGLAKSLSSNSISTKNDFIGTIKYSAPEIFSKGKHTIESDIYSLGLVFYELLTLTHPFDNSKDASPEYIINKIIKGEITPPEKLNNKIPQSLSNVIMKMLSKNPSQRYKNMKEVSESVILSKQSGIERIISDITSLFTKKEDEIKISAIDKELSNEKLKSAINLYIHLDFNEMTSLIIDAINFNFLNLDAYLLYILISTHIYNFSKKIKEKALELNKYENYFTEEEKEKLKIITLFFSEDKKWIDYAVSYSKRYSNFIIYLIIARKREDLMEIYLKKAMNEYPKFKIFIEAYLDIIFSYKKNEINKLIELKNKKDVEILARVALIEKYLNDYEFEKAEKEMKELEEKYPYHCLTLYLKLHILIIKENFEQIIITINKIISILNDDIKFQYYYMLYLLYKKLDDEKSQKYYTIAQNLTDENLPTIEEIKNEAFSIDYSIFDFIDNNLLKFSYSTFLKDFLYYLFEEKLSSFKVNLKLITLEENGECMFSYISSKPQGRIDFIPLGNFYDIKGNILKAKYIQKDERSYNVVIEEKILKKNLPVIFIGTQNSLLERKEDGYIINYSETILAPRKSKRIFAISSKFKINYESVRIENYELLIFDINTIKTYKPYDMNLKIQVTY